MQQPRTRALGIRLALASAVLVGCALIVLGVDRVRLLMANVQVADGDRLNFYAAMLGAVLGAILAIGGALLIEEIRLYMDGRSDRQLIRDALAELQLILEPIADDPITYEEPELWSSLSTKLSLESATLILADVTVVLTSAPSRARLSTFRQVSAINRTVETAAVLRDRLREAAGTEGSELASRMKASVKPVVERLLQQIEVASRELGH